nr:unnamed protein product [Callosobruchus chinensis]
MSESTEWNREKCLQLIDQYEKYSKLWNPKHGLYYNKVKKNDAWEIIDGIMECSKGESKKKMYSMLSSFRREKAKGNKSVGTHKNIISLSKSSAVMRVKFFKWPLSCLSAKHCFHALQIDASSIFSSFYSSFSLKPGNGLGKKHQLPL